MFILRASKRVVRRTIHGSVEFVFCRKIRAILRNAEFFLDHFTDLKCLEYLNLEGTYKFTGKFLLSINCDALVNHDLSETTFYTGYVCQLLKKCTILEQVTLSNSGDAGRDEKSFNEHCVGGINRQIFECLVELKNLKILHLNDYDIGYLNDVDGLNGRRADEIVANCLGKCANLIQLCLTRNYFVTNNVMLGVARNCGKLKLLCIDLNLTIHSEELDSLSSLLELIHLPRLESLTFCWSNVSDPLDDTVIAPISRLRWLRSLTLRATFNLPCDGRALLMLENLTRLRLSGNWVDDELIKSLCQSVGPKLEIFEVPECKKVTDLSTPYIAACSQLDCLNLNLTSVTGRSLRELNSKFKLLEIFGFFIEETGDAICENLLEFLQFCPHIYELYVNSDVRRKLEENTSFNANIAIKSYNDYRFVVEEYVFETFRTDELFLKLDLKLENL